MEQRGHNVSKTKDKHGVERRSGATITIISDPLFYGHVGPIVTVSMCVFHDQKQNQS